jgi:glycosyltransferase involved in cell wall biosynthesis
MSARRLLVVTYAWPPIPSVGANRWLATTKYLRRLGHEVTVLTTSLMGPAPDDERQGVVRAFDLAGAAVVRRALRRPPLTASDGSPLPSDVPPPATLTRLAVPDVYLASWVPFATAAVRRLVREREIECVITSTPYESTHLCGIAAQRLGSAWIADFRDGWTLEPHRPPFPTAVQRRLDARLERLVVERADRVLAATVPIVDDFRRRLGVDAAYVPNAWDPELEPAEPAPDTPALAEDLVSLVHTGTLSGGWGRDPGPLLAALRALLAEDPDLPSRLELVLAGRPKAEEARLFTEGGLARLVRVTGLVSREAALELQRRADALLLLTSPHSRSEATGKLFEYLGARRPILALAEGNEAARIVTSTRTGTTVPPDDSHAIAAALRALAVGDLPPYEPRGLDRHLFPDPAAAVAGQVEAAIAARQAAGRRATA